MASDITLAVGDGSRRMTYAELAQARGISLASARRLARRHRWPRQVGNDGIVRILVPLGHLHSPPVKALESLDSDVPRLAHAMSDGTSLRTDDLSDGTGPGSAYAMSHETAAQAGLGHVRAFESAIEALREQLTKAEQRADEAQTAERKAIELVKFATAEASEQRRRADDAATAERIARDEAAGLRARLDQLQARGLWARLRNKR